MQATKTRTKRQKPSVKKSGYVLYFLKEHSLSLVLAGITITLKIAGYFMPEGYWQDSLNGFGDDSWGAFLIIVCTKYFIEQGSPESKDTSSKN